jgi:hypothetical protein
MTLITPYAGSYGIAGHPDLVAIAYFGHVAYGTPLGIIVRQAAQWRSREDAPVPVSWAVGAVAAILLVWHQPWSIPASVGAAESLRPQPASLVEAGKFVPEWVRVPAGGCVLLANHDTATYTLRGVGDNGGVAATLAASSQGRFCFRDAGVKRVQLNGVPYSGGFVIVDPALHP